MQEIRVPSAVRVAGLFPRSSGIAEFLMHPFAARLVGSEEKMPLGHRKGHLARTRMPALLIL